MVEGNSKSTLLFIHGAWHNSIYFEKLVDQCQERGMKTVVFDLPGHGNTPAEKSLRRYSIADYREYVSEIIDELDEAVIIVGHSMGGMVALDLLDKSDNVQQGILLVPANRAGVWKFTLKFLFKHPLKFLKVIFTLSLHPIIEDRDLAFELFYGDNIDRESVENYLEILQDESFRVFIDFLIRQPKPDHKDILIIAAENDVIFPVNNLEGLASRLNADLEVIDGPHNFMVEHPQETVELIFDWISSK